MKGSEKQITWANEIRENVVKALEFVGANSPANVLAEVQKRIDLLNEANVYAGDVINLFGDIRFGSDEMKNAKAVMFVYNRRGYVPVTTGEKSLLCK